MSALLRNRDFLSLWWIGLASFLVRWLEILVFGVYTYEHTGSAFLVAMMTMVRLVPMALFGAMLGALAERINKRVALFAVLWGSLITSLALVVIGYAGHLEVWHLGVASFINGTAWAADNPVRRAMIGEAAGDTNMGLAMSLEVGTSNASRLAGPSIGGLLLAMAGINGTFLLAVVLYLGTLLAALFISPGATPKPEVRPGTGARPSRLAVLRSDRRMTGTMWLTIVFNIFGWPLLSMVPVISKDQLGLDEAATGLLASTDGLGAFVGAVVLARLASRPNYGRIYALGVLLFIAMLPVFALSKTVWFAALALFLVGFGQAAFAVMQATLTFVFAPPGMRSQAMGLMTMCIGIGPLGFALVGTLAESIGAPMTTLAMSLSGLAILILSWPWWRHTWTAPDEPVTR